MRRLFAIVAVLGSVACGDNGSTTPDASPPDASPPDAPAPDARVDATVCAVGACSAGQMMCGTDGTLVSCVLDTHGCGSFPTGGGTACGAHSSCQSGAATCTCDAAPTCTAGAGVYCTTDGGTPATYTCATDSDGCVYAQPTLTDCFARQSCTGSAGAAMCTCNADASCSAGMGTYCTTDAANGNAPATYTCTPDAHGCVAAGVTLSDCGGHQQCGGTPGVDVCSCNVDPVCPSAGAFCSGADAVTCAADADGCFYEASSSTCTAPAVCSLSGGTPSCVCPAAGTGAGDGCGILGVQSCSAGGDVLTCQTENGCNVWVDTTRCGGLGCQVTGTTASCDACPAATGGTFYADPAAAAGGSGVAPTGAQSPVACRFSTVGDAIGAASAYASANSPPATVIVTSASPGSFTAESWPLVVPAAVSVTSDDVALPPARYTLAPSAGSAAAIVDGGGALGGLAISVDLSANGSPAAVTLGGCSSGAPSVNVGPLAIAFAANAQGDGIDLADPDPSGSDQACAASIDRVSITGAWNGIAVSTDVGAWPTTASATITGSTVSACLNDGVVVFQTAATGVTIDTTTVGGSQSANVHLDTSFAGHTAALSMTGTYGQTTIDASSFGSFGVEVDNGQFLPPSATLALTDVQVLGSPTAGAMNAYGFLIDGGTARLAGVVAESNIVAGLYVNGGTVTVGDDAAGNHSIFEATSGAGNAGLQINSGSTVTATNVISRNNSSWGVIVTNSVAGLDATHATLNGCTFTGNGDGGLFVPGWDSSHLTNVIVNGSAFDDNAGPGISARNYALVDMQGTNTTSHNGGDGVLVNGFGTTYFEETGSFHTYDGNAGDGIDDVSGVVQILGASSSDFVLKNNGGAGVRFTGGRLYLSGITFASNTDAGLIAHMNGSGDQLRLIAFVMTGHDGSSIVIDDATGVTNAVQIQLGTITGGTAPAAGTYGVEIRRATAPSGTVGVLLGPLTITGCNAGVGIGLGTSNPLGVALGTLTIENNLGAGVLYSSTATNNHLEMVGNKIAGNGASAWGDGTASVGGLGLAGSAPASSQFGNNTIGANAANQVFVYQPASGETDSYDLSGGMGQNQIIQCSSDPTIYGLYVVQNPSASGSTLTVNADNDYWLFGATNDIGTVGSGVAVSSNGMGSASCPTVP